MLYIISNVYMKPIIYLYTRVVPNQKKVEYLNFCRVTNSNFPIVILLEHYWSMHISKYNTFMTQAFRCNFLQFLGEYDVEFSLLFWQLFRCTKTTVNRVIIPIKGIVLNNKWCQILPYHGKGRFACINALLKFHSYRGFSPKNHIQNRFESANIYSM